MRFDYINLLKTRRETPLPARTSDTVIWKIAAVRVQIITLHFLISHYFSPLWAGPLSVSWCWKPIRRWHLPPPISSSHQGSAQIWSPKRSEDKKGNKKGGAQQSRTLEGLEGRVWRWRWHLTSMEIRRWMRFLRHTPVGDCTSSEDVPDAWSLSPSEPIFRFSCTMSKRGKQLLLGVLSTIYTTFILHPHAK